MADEDWDLHAIVRSCTSVTTAASTASVDVRGGGNDGKVNNPLNGLTFDEEDDPFSFPDLVYTKNIGFHELQDSYKPFLPAGGEGNVVCSSSISVFGGFPQLSQQQSSPPTTSIAISTHFNSTNHQQQEVQYVKQPQQQPNQRPQQLHPQGTQRLGTATSPVLPLRPMQPQAPRSRKKKSQQKRLVVHLTAENLSSDVWAWRKYGQKPIKGSPYPRNYYRCSSSKGCAARKQVERSNTDPNLFIVSYTGDHSHPRPSHRNSLAGSTRSKFPATNQKPPADKEATALNVSEGPSCSSPLSTTSLSPRTPLSAHMEHEAAVANENIDAENRSVGDMEGQKMESDDGDDDDDEGVDDDDGCDDDILIPNMVINEDLINGLQELGSSSDNIGSSRSFGDNNSSWAVGSSASAGAGATAGGGAGGGW